ncbi:response regulator transcription factor [Brevibacillus fluminis]|uniref:response regulator transcription factor n=1 Tax=Brevibacillus fluminis TaxID=511487 RepID=UPI001605FB08|nr:response regulator transcription factor [Brevibacillus fluminis]
MGEGKILVVEDETEIRELVRMYLENSRFQVVEAELGKQALQLFAEEEPDLVILDILLPDSDGISLCRSIKRMADVPILFLTCKMESEDIITGLNTGGDDYMTKPFDPGILIARVHALLRRQTMLQRLGSRLQEETEAQDGSRQKAGYEQVGLTQRELEILQLIDKGFTNQEIAQTLYLSPGTVKGYNNQIFGKLDVKNRTQAMAKARELGIL